MRKTKPPACGGGSFDKTSYQKEKLATDFVHSGATHWTLAFHCRFAVFHCDFDSFWIVALRAAFYTIHLCHTSIHLLSTFYKNI